MSNASDDDDDSTLNPGSLYALLSYRGELGSWEWSFFVPNSAITPVGSEGMLFYVKIITADDGTFWKFEKMQRDIISSPEAVALVQLADVADLGHYDEIVGENGLCPMFNVVAIPSRDSSTPMPVDFSSRSWFLDAVGMLHDCGVVQCDDVWLLEREIRRFAFSAMDKYLQNRGCTVYRAEKCS